MGRPFRLLFAPLIVGLALCAPLAADETAQVEKDRTAFLGLLRELSGINVEAVATVAQALGEARLDRSGRPRPETASHLADLRDRRDRLVARASWLAVVRGWEAPNPALPELEATPRSPEEAGLEPARRIVLRAFEHDAARIARIVPLPLLPAPAVSR
ncbi:MAG: hypothetical protein HYZ53_30290 [Planctomycetes bacterium]|nr:hypothetical protein [Planctomycetota bacterium]